MFKKHLIWIAALLFKTNFFRCCWIDAEQELHGLNQSGLAFEIKSTDFYNEKFCKPVHPLRLQAKKLIQSAKEESFLIKLSSFADCRAMDYNFWKHCYISLQN